MIERVFFGRMIRALAVALFVAPAFALPASTAASALVPAHVTFEGIPWGSARRTARAQLEAAGFTYASSTPDDYYHGTVDGAGATVVCVFTPEDELTYVRVYFDAAVPGVYDALHADYGNAAPCDPQHDVCRWERGTEEVTLTAHPAAAPVADTPDIEYSDTGLAAKYDFEINHKEHQYHDKSDM